MPSGIFIKNEEGIIELEQPFAPLILDFGDGASINKKTGEIILSPMVQSVPPLRGQRITNIYRTRAGHLAVESEGRIDIIFFDGG